MSRSYQRILVSTDFSDTADAALDEAASLAKATGAEIILLHVASLPDPGIPTGIDLALIPSLSSLQQLIRERGKVLRSTLETEQRRLADAGIEKVRYELREGHPGAVIPKAAVELGCDVVVMGTHGRGALAHMLLGSTTDEVIRSSTVPVLLVRHASEA